MSAGNSSAHADSDLSRLAPKFRDAMVAFIKEANEAGIDAIIYEAYRSNALQQIYYARGRTVIPPRNIVTNAKTNTYSWHGFSLACDVISKEKEWDRPESWFERLAEIAKKHGLKWGGDWRQRDLPHFQFGACKPSPSDEARRILKDEGIEAVWRKVGAA